MKNIKSYEDFCNEEINLKKALAGAALGASLMGGMTSCKKTDIEPIQQEILKPSEVFKFQGDWYIYKTVQGGGQGVLNPRPDVKITFITKFVESIVDAQVISLDSDEDGITDTQYNWGSYSNESGDIVIKDSLTTKNGTYAITTASDPVWGKYPVLSIQLDNNSYQFEIGHQEDYNKGFQIPYHVDNQNVFGINKSFILKRL